MTTALLTEHPAPGVVLLRINRPEAKNALNEAVRSGLLEAFTALAFDEETRAIVITGGEIFAAGADVRDMVERQAVDMMTSATPRVWEAITRCPKPIIAAVNGYAWGGGCELAMSADIIVAGEGATFCQPEVKLGIMPGAGGTQRLTRAVGKYQAMKMLLTGRPVNAREAFAMGLVSEVVADNKCIETAIEIATTIAAMPVLAVRQIKETVTAGQDLALDAALRLERKAFQLLFATADQKEGMRAFVEKRNPQFSGR